MSNWIVFPKSQVTFSNQTFLITLFFVYFINSFFKIYFYFWLLWVSVAAHGLSLVVAIRLSLVAVSRGLFFVAVRVLLIAVASRCGARALGTWASVVVARGLSSCGSQALERRLSSCGARA